MFDTSHINSNSNNRNDAYESARSDAVASDLASLQHCNKSLYVCLVFLSLFLVGGGIALGVTSNSSDSASATAKTAAVPVRSTRFCFFSHSLFSRFGCSLKSALFTVTVVNVCSKKTLKQSSTSTTITITTITTRQGVITL